MRQPTGQPSEAWVLVADADDAAARALAGALRHQGVWAYPTTRGDEALWLALTRPLALAVIDAWLEDMAGHELISRLKCIDDGLPVIVTTGDRRAESEVAARRAGIVYYAPKPVDLRRLEAVVARILSDAAPAPATTPVTH